jgi:hypothetical protein
MKCLLIVSLLLVSAACHRIPLGESQKHSYEKYSDMIDTNTSFMPQKSFNSQVKELVWGKDERKKKFEAALQKHTQTEPGQRPKLGQA